MTASQNKIELDAQKRDIFGRKVRGLRESGLIPAVLYGKGQEPISLQVPEKEFNKVLQEAGESTLVYINVDGESYPTIIHDVARDPATDKVIHADFYKVNLKEKIVADVPVVFVGESPAVKDLNGIFVRNINELEVEALPQDLPHELTIDISVLKNIDDKITIGDLRKGLGTLAELIAEDDDIIIATVQEPKSQEELDAELSEPSASVEDVEVIKKEKEEDSIEGEDKAESGDKGQES